MNADERDVCLYLKGFAGQFVSFKEISKRASGKRRFAREPEWATAVLHRLVAKGTIESDAMGHYRLKARAKTKQGRPASWLSPEIRKILEASGKNFEASFEVDQEEDDTTKE